MIVTIFFSVTITYLFRTLLDVTMYFYKDTPNVALLNVTYLFMRVKIQGKIII